MLSFITRNIWIISIVSFFNDVAGEMLTPIMPLYLKSIGFTLVAIGLLEGIAEATAGLSKGYFGRFSDTKGKRLPFVQVGYVISAIVKPMMIFSTNSIWIFFVRTLGLFGKGVRSSARDAMLSDEATLETKGRVFGFHGALDTFGAALGPLIALIYLFYYPLKYEMLFMIAFIPSILAILLTFFIKEKPREVPKKQTLKFLDFLKYWKQSPALYRKLLVGLLGFALFNSSDAFLLLRIKEATGSDYFVIYLFIFYNLVYALAAYPAGVLADKLGMKKIFIIGCMLFAVSYFCMGFVSDIYLFFVLFFIYGVYSAMTDGVAKAWISNISDKKDTATAIGTYNAFHSVATLCASSIAGLIAFFYSIGTSFYVTALATVFVILYLLFFLKEEQRAL